MVEAVPIADPERWIGVWMIHRMRQIEQGLFQCIRAQAGRKTATGSGEVKVITRQNAGDELRQTRIAVLTHAQIPSTLGFAK